MSYSVHSLHAGSSSKAVARSGAGRFGQEIGLIAGLLALFFWVLALLTYAPQDPAWSTSGTGDGQVVLNWLGRLGAWVADLSYYMLGFSVWWAVVAGARAWLGALSRWMRGESAMAPLDSMQAWHRRMVFWGGLILLLCASAGLEWARLYRMESDLPGHAGGILGYLMGPTGMQWLGFTGSGIVGICAAITGVAMVFRFSWGRCAEALGAQVDSLFALGRSRRERAQDKRVGRQAAQARAADVRQGQAERSYDTELATDALQEEANLSAPQSITAGFEPDRKADTTPAPVPPPPSSKRRAALPPHAERTEPDLRWDIEPESLDEAASDDPPWATPAVATYQPEVKASVPPERLQAALPAERSVSRVVPPASVAPSTIGTASAGVANATITTHVRPVLHTPVHGGLGLPDISLLDAPPSKQETVAPETLEMTSRLIEKKLKDFGVEVKVVYAAPGPVVTRYEIEPATGVKGSQVVNLAKDLARSLSLVSVRVIETIPGKNYMALELPNAKRQTIRLSEVLGSKAFTEARSLLTTGLGKDIVGNPVVADLAKMPHVMVAGTTGSGKSVGINAMILSLLYKADAKDVRIMMIDPKMLEMSVYEGIPHLLCPVVTDMKQAAHGLNWCVAEMEKRYKLMSKLGVRNLAGYNAKIDEAHARETSVPNPFSLTPESPEPLQRLPHIVIIIDELADLMMVVGKKIEELIARLAQKARAAGIHLILATQRPSVDVITGLIKANIPSRIAFSVGTKTDSRVILDQMGAESLLGMGDMLYMASGTGLPVRVHGAFVSDDEVHKVVNFLKAQGEPDYVEGILEGGSPDGDGDIGGDGNGGEKDPMYDQAVEIVLKDRKASISYVQRKLRIGYNRSARLLEDMENAGIVSSLTSSGQREVLVPYRNEE